MEWWHWYNDPTPQPIRQSVWVFPVLFYDLSEGESPQIRILEAPLWRNPLIQKLEKASTAVTKCFFSAISVDPWPPDVEERQRPKRLHAKCGYINSMQSLDERFVHFKPTPRL